LRKALLAAVSEEDMLVIGRQLAALAREGDVAAAKLLFSYVVGKPGPVVDPDSLDVQEWQLFRQQPVDGGELLGVLQQVPAELGCQILRAARPDLVTSMARMLKEMLEQSDAADRAAAAESRPARPGSRRRARAEGERSTAAAVTPTADETAGAENMAAEQAGESAGQKPAEPGTAGRCAPINDNLAGNTSAREEESGGEAKTVTGRRTDEASDGAPVENRPLVDAPLPGELQELLGELIDLLPGRPGPAPLANGGNGPSGGNRDGSARGAAGGQ
jgi:hypothetical protein